MACHQGHYKHALNDLLQRCVPCCHQACSQVVHSMTSSCSQTFHSWLWSRDVPRWQVYRAVYTSSLSQHARAHHDVSSPHPEKNTPKVELCFTVFNSRMFIEKSNNLNFLGIWRKHFFTITIRLLLLSK